MTCPTTVPDVSTLLRPSTGAFDSFSVLVRRPRREMNASSPDRDRESKVKVACSVAVPLGSTELASGTWRTLLHDVPGAIAREGSVAGMVDASAADGIARPRPVGIYAAPLGATRKRTARLAAKAAQASTALDAELGGELTRSESVTLTIVAPSSSTDSTASVASSTSVPVSATGFPSAPAGPVISTVWSSRTLIVSPAPGRTCSTTLLACAPMEPDTSINATTPERRQCQRFAFRKGITRTGRRSGWPGSLREALAGPPARFARCDGTAP